MSNERKWSNSELESDAVSKKELVQFLLDSANYEFLKSRKLYGKVAPIAKSSKKDVLIAAYNDLYADELNWRPAGESLEDAAEAAKQQIESTKPAAVPIKPAEVETETPKYTKQVLKKGNGQSIPKKGDTVSCFYVGTLEDGTVFDTNITGKKKPTPLRFKVGTGRVIRGWDEALMTMSMGEKAKLVIESEWAYGKKGLPAAKIPPNANLTFEVELVGVE